VQRRDGDLPSFLDTATESLEVLSEVFERDPRMPWVAKVLLEPERMITFRVSYVDDSSITRVNRAYRCQWSSALGPYTGSLHFGQHVSPDIIKSLAYSTTIRNAMAGLPFGGACGGSDFDADNKSDGEIQRFCQSFMTELSKYVSSDEPARRIMYVIAYLTIVFIFLVFFYLLCAGRSGARYTFSWDGCQPSGAGLHGGSIQTNQGWR